MHKSIYTQQYQTLLEILREVRAAVGMTQGDLADRLGMGQSDISKCEMGTRRLDVVELKLWVEALGSDLPSVVRELEDRGKSSAILSLPHAQEVKSRRNDNR